ncbi:hypothetical protein NST37_04585 [Brevibacillus sp. FSL K6-6036]|uniref:hypothetical protein n=1 Tax=Brevibacillus sp. FSL K6-6036 TaxID=2954682 RepID=UPI0030D5CA13
MLFSVDVAASMGYPVQSSLRLFRHPEAYRWFLLLTFLMGLRVFVKAGIRALLISRFGIEGYGVYLSALSLGSWLTYGIILAAYGYIFRKHIYPLAERLEKEDYFHSIGPHP